jgi:hypothetical protein
MVEQKSSPPLFDRSKNSFSANKDLNFARNEDKNKILSCKNFLARELFIMVQNPGIIIRTYSKPLMTEPIILFLT